MGYVHSLGHASRSLTKGIPKLNLSIFAAASSADQVENADATMGISISPKTHHNNAWMASSANRQVCSYFRIYDRKSTTSIHLVEC